MKKQSGFTLIELVVVIVILGIMSAVAIPKFVDMTSQARTAKMQGAVGAANSSIAIVHAKWLALGSPAGATPTVAVEGGVTLVPNVATDLTNGYPAASAFQTSTYNLAGLDSNFSTTFAAGVTTVKDVVNTSCLFTITNSTGAGVPPVISAISGC